MSIDQLHEPVMLERCIELLAPALESDGAVLVDCTLGLGGHTEAFLERFPNLQVVGLDRDPNALKLAQQRLERFGSRVKFCHVVYNEITDALDDLGIESVQGVLMDLGVSSMQLDESERGFAYSYEAPLDMRMDNTTGITAADVVNDYEETDLVRIFKEFGEERYARQIARAVVAARRVAKFETSTQLASLIVKVVPFIPGKSSGHPAKRVFQALRIEVNAELDALKEAMPQVVKLLAVGGRVDRAHRGRHAGSGRHADRGPGPERPVRRQRRRRNRHLLRIAGDRQRHRQQQGLLARRRRQHRVGRRRRRARPPP